MTAREPTSHAGLPPIERPNGKMYQPRKLIAVSWSNDGDPLEDWAGCIVLGTHDVDVARLLAERACGYFHGTRYAVKPSRVWVRDGFENGERIWVYDEVRGRAGVRWVASDDPEELA